MPSKSSSFQLVLSERTGIDWSIHISRGISGSSKETEDCDGVFKRDGEFSVFIFINWLEMVDLLCHKTVQKSMKNRSGKTSQWHKKNGQIINR
jgi:hypothetical protein